MRILIVDDSAEIAEAVARRLKRVGEVEVAVASSAEKAKRAIFGDARAPADKYGWDAILLDIQLTEGGHEGVEVAQWVRTSRVVRTEQKIIAHSSYDRIDQARLLAPVGVKHFARKGSLDILACLEDDCDCTQLLERVRAETAPVEPKPPPSKLFTGEFRVDVDAWLYRRHLILDNTRIKMEIARTNCRHCPTCSSRIRHVERYAKNPVWDHVGGGMYIELPRPAEVVTRQDIVQFVGRELGLGISF